MKGQLDIIIVNHHEIYMYSGMKTKVQHLVVLPVHTTSHQKH